MLLEDAWFWHDQPHADHHLIQPIKVSQVLAIHIVPHVQGVVDGQPCTADLGHQTHPTVTLEVWKGRG